MSTMPNGSTPSSRSRRPGADRKSTRLNSSHLVISYAVFCLKKKICVAAVLSMGVVTVASSSGNNPVPDHQTVPHDLVTQMLWCVLALLVCEAQAALPTHWPR